MAGDEADSGTQTGLLHQFQTYHIPAFIAGATLILFLAVLNRGMQDSIGLAVLGEEIVTPIRIALIGLGTGYYLGDAVAENHSGIVVFHVGAFLALLGLAVWSIRIEPITIILILAVLFAFAMNVSTLVDAHDDIRSAFDALARDGSRGGLVALILVQYSVSLMAWTGVQLSSFNTIDKVVIIVVTLVVLYFSVKASSVITTELNAAAEKSE